MTRSMTPFLEVARIQSEINHLFENLLDLERATQEGAAWIPNVDILESEDGVVVKVELPGVRAADVRLSTGGGVLTIEGVKHDPETPDAAVLARERPEGRFRRSLPVPVPVNTRQARATLADGVLRVEFPKVPNRRGEEVFIEVHTR